MIKLDDIMWFKPVELRTKYGRRGHIKEPLGVAVLFEWYGVHVVYPICRYTWSHEVCL